MKRRSFIAGFVKACVAASVAANLVREETLMPVQRSTYDPLAYVGEFRWINDTVKCAWTERHRAAYKDLVDKQ